MRLEREEKESKKRLKEVWLLKINFLFLHSQSERVTVEEEDGRGGKRNLKKGYKKFGY